MVDRKEVFEETQKEKKEEKQEKILGSEKNTTERAPAVHYKPAFIYIRW